MRFHHLTFFYTLSIFLSSSVASSQIFTDVAGEVGLVLDHLDSGICNVPVASGSAWADFDNDGDVDLYVTNHGGPNYLYRNEGDDDGDGLPSFLDVATASGVDLTDEASHGAVFVDIDNDGDQDLYVTNWGGNTLYRNLLVESGLPLFEDVTLPAGVGDAGRAVTATWADYNQDSYLDLYLAKHRNCPGDPQSQDRLFRNNGDGSFTDVSGSLCPGGVAPCSQLTGLGFTGGWFDFDNDGDQDLYLVNDYPTGSYVNVLWRNDGPDGLGGWLFTDISEQSGTNIGANGMGLGVGDYDNDGWLDFAFSNSGPNYLLRNNGDGTFGDVSEAAGIQREQTPGGALSITWGTVFFDHEGDGWQDLFFVAGPILDIPVDQPNAFFLNNKDGTFTDISVASGLDDPVRGRSASIVDLNNDGLVDLFVGNLFLPPRLYFNQGRSQGNQNHWLTVTTEGTVSNRDGIGTRITLSTPDGLTQTREISSGPTYGGGDYKAAFFGLGENTAGSLSVRWPGGIEEDLGTVSADQILHLVEPDTGLPAMYVEISIDPDHLLVPAEGDTFHFDLTFTSTISDTIPFDIWVTNVLPDGARRSVIGPKTPVLGPLQIITKSPLLRVPGSGPPGEYTLEVYWGEAGSFPTDTLGISTAVFTKLNPGSATPAQASSTIGPADRVSLGQNYPNPFNPTTSITYSVTENTDVYLAVYDLVGQEIAMLVNGPQGKGTHTASWNGRNNEGNRVPSGVYFYRLVLPGWSQTRLMTLIK